MGFVPILEISDGVNTVNLLNRRSGITLRNWVPSYFGLKDNGVRASSPLTHGERVTVQTYTDVIDTFDLDVGGCDQDVIIESIQNLQRLLTKGVQYWTTDWQSDPVWIRARGPGETNIRYAIVKDYRWPNDENPYSQPFFNCRAQPAMTTVSLVLEHGIWQSTAPGDGDGILIDGAQDADLYEEGMYYPTIQADDGYAAQFAMSFTLNAANLLFGNDFVAGEIYDTAVRFRNLAIPAGATIVYAYIQFTQNAADAGDFVPVTIYGEDNATPASFGNYADYMGRARTAAFVNWEVPAWDGSAHVTSPDISAIIQEIVDLGGWASGNDLAIFVEDNSADPNEYRDACSVDHVPSLDPLLHVFWTYGEHTFGQEDGATVYVANKHNRAQLTHVFTYSVLGGFSANLIGTALPWNFNAEDVLFCIASDSPGSGPYCSLVFDLSAANTDVNPTWQYYAPAGFTAIPDEDLQDNTNGLTTLGVSSVHWEPPDDWTLMTVNGIEGWWIIINCTDAVQQNRDVYTILWPYVDIEEEDVEGDIPALMQIQAYNVSGSITEEPVFVLIDEDDNPNLQDTYTMFTDTDDQIVFRAGDAAAGLTTYLYTDGGALTYADQALVGGAAAYDVWAGNGEAYVAWSTAGVRVYEYDAAGNLTYTDDDNTITASGIWYDGTYICVASLGALRTYTYNAGTNTLTLVDSEVLSGAYCVWGDGTYIYVGSLNGAVGIEICTVNGAGAITLVTNISAGGSAVYGITGNDSFLFANCEDALLTFAKGVGTLTLVNTYATGGVAGLSSVRNRKMWLYDNYLFVTWMNNLLVADYEVDYFIVYGDGSVSAPTTLIENAAGTSGDDANALLFVGGADAVQAENVYSYRMDEFAAMPHTRLLCGLRALDRGTNFDAYINLTSEQNGDHIQVAQVGAPLTTDVPPSITGEYVTVNTAAIADPATVVIITIEDEIAEEYLGAYHAFLRVWQASGDPGDITFRVNMTIGAQGTELVGSEMASVLETGTFSLVDLGVFIIPAVLSRTNNVGDITINVQVGATVADAIETRLYDLILLPIDEWAGDFNNVSATTYLPLIGDGSYLEAGSIVIPKRTITAYLYDSTGVVQDVYLPISNGEAILQANKDQRLWFLEWARTNESNAAYGEAKPFICLKIALFKAQRYFSMRGSR